MPKTHPQPRTHFCAGITRDDLFKDAAHAIMNTLNRDIPNDATLVRLSQTLKAVVNGNKNPIEREKKSLIRLYEKEGADTRFADTFISEANKWLDDNPERKEALSKSLERAGAGR